jgi:hypothetical protein
VTGAGSLGGPDLRSVLGFQIQTTRRWAVGMEGRLTGSEWLSRPQGVRNHPHWIYGHVALSSDFAPGVADVPMIVPGEWEALFGQGSRPDPEGQGYPSPETLRDVIERAMDRNLEVLQDLPLDSLHEPIRLALPQALLDFLRTRERWLGFSCLHLSYHLGQISLIEKALHGDPA